MDNSKYPAVPLPAKVITKLGPIFITPTEANHLHVSSRGNGGTENYLTLRGCEYYVSAHFYAYQDGTFNIGPEFTEAQDSNGKHTRPTNNTYERRQSLYISNHSASESARTKIAEVLTEAVTKWVSENPETIAAAHIEHLHEKVESALADVHKAKEVLNQAETELRTAKQILRAAEQAVRS
jgi:hypothetical protein